MLRLVIGGIPGSLVLRTTVVQLLTNIHLLRGPERPPFFSLSTLTSRHYPLRTAEWARMPETAPLSAFVYFVQDLSFKVLFLWEVEFCASPKGPD